MTAATFFTAAFVISLASGSQVVTRDVGRHTRPTASGVIPIFDRGPRVGISGLRGDARVPRRFEPGAGQNGMQSGALSGTSDVCCKRQTCRRLEPSRCTRGPRWGILYCQVCSVLRPTT